MTKGKHLLARKRNAYGTLQIERRHSREKKLVFGPQAGTERAAHVRREDANLIVGKPENAANVLLTVLHALRLLVDGERTVGFINDRGAEQLNGVVMLHWDEVLFAEAHGRGFKHFFGLTALFGRRRYAGSRTRFIGLLALPFQISLVRVCFIFH